MTPPIISSRRKRWSIGFAWVEAGVGIKLVFRRITTNIAETTATKIIATARCLFRLNFGYPLHKAIVVIGQSPLI